ncbi:MAG: hypothetical protein KF816_11700 [Melioribacteraceae bacterium]|nr:hypothetical protein [Melioribacteraceae bacterium]
MEENLEPKIKRSFFRKLINVFIGFAIFLVFILIIFIGISQTKTFREYLRNKTIELVNDEINGRLDIGSIEGTLFTRLKLNNTSITIGKDTLINANLIEVNINPIHLFLQNISLKRILLSDVHINLLQDSTGKWNYENLMKPSPEDTTKSDFKFKIQLSDFSLQNITIKRQSLNYIGSTASYKTLNFDDLRLDNFYLSASAFIDIYNSNYLLKLKEIAFTPNSTRFNLRNISGDFAVTKDFVSISNFYFITDSSQINLDFRIDSLDLFAGIELDDLKNYPIYINIDAPSFNFDDLSSYIESTEILKGSPSLKLSAQGYFGNFTIGKASIDYRNTSINFNGRVQNLNNPSKLYLKAKLEKTNVDYHDINALMPWLELPEYAKSQFTDLNMEFEGEPTNFKSKLKGNIDNGSISVSADMNLGVEPIIYDIKFESKEINLFPILNIPTKLNSFGSIKGAGSNFNNLETQLKFDASSSIFDDYYIDQLNISSKASEKRIDLTIEGNVGEIEALVIGEMDFRKDTIPEYNFLGSLKNIDLAKVLKDNYYDSNLNFYFSAEGKGIDIDEMNGNFSFGIDSSRFRDKNIGYSNIDLNIQKDSLQRNIKLVSDFLDFELYGNFSLLHAAELLAYEGKVFSTIITEKIRDLNPLSSVSEYKKIEVPSSIIPPAITDSLKINYDYLFKDFELISMLIGSNRMEISGKGDGIISNDGRIFSITVNTDLEYIIITREDQTVYLSGSLLKINLSRDNTSFSFDDLWGSVALASKRFYFGQNYKDIFAELNFNHSIVDYNTAVEIDDMLKTKLKGKIFIGDTQQQIFIDSLKLKVSDFEFTNKDTIRAFFNPFQFMIDHCALHRDSTNIDIKGTIENSGALNLTLLLDNISGDILGKYLLGIEDNKLVGDGKLKARITGDLTAPILKVETQIDNLIYAETKLGSLQGMIDYDEQVLNANLTFLDSTNNKNSPLLTLKGHLPINLSIGTVDKRIFDDRELSFSLKSSKFNLNALGRTIPAIFNQRGFLDADVNLSGTLYKPKYTGYVNLTDGYFKMDFNNLEYKCSGKALFTNSGLNFEDFTIENTGENKLTSLLRSNGAIQFEGFEMKDLSFNFFGDIALFGMETQKIDPLFYGDLVIGTDGDLKLTKINNRYYLKGDIVLKNTNLVYTTGIENYSASSKNFDFTFIEDTLNRDAELIRFRKILEQELTSKSALDGKKQNQINLDYSFGIRADNEAKLTFILSQAANQKLTVLMRGDIKYESTNNQIFAQGGFELLPGSKLDFFKVFEATGKISFESDITNPYLDIVATYTSDYVDPRDETGTPQDVAVKIKIQGPLSQLGQNIASNPESMSIYVGARNIQNNVRDSKYDYADALSFILFSKFKDDLTAQDRTEIAGTSSVIGNTATSFLGSVLSSFVNSTVGDLVNNISINQSGDSYKFSLGGRFQNLRYSFGGTTEVFQNISKANLKVEYLFNPRFLIRLERKEPIGSNYSLDDKVTEMALKYRFEF